MQIPTWNHIETSNRGSGLKIFKNENIKKNKAHKNVPVMYFIPVKLWKKINIMHMSINKSPLLTEEELFIFLFIFIVNKKRQKITRCYSHCVQNADRNVIYIQTYFIMQTIIHITTFRLSFFLHSWKWKCIYVWIKIIFICKNFASYKKNSHLER